ncbi:MAG TPA: PLP-dependent aminotransferase family protein [Pseudonocardiaceae bacterium]|nr:PLP-dependent aminotransferase family protein [Pseudonocardiaceae bacterium]
MSADVFQGGRVSARRLVELLGSWRDLNARHPSADLADGIRLLAQEGRLPAGTRLPPERELAEALTVSRTLVTKAVDELREEGVVASRQGSGSWITAQEREYMAIPELGGGEVIDLARASPEAVPAMLGAVDAAMRRLPVLLRGHGYQPQGLPELREAIAARYRTRGLPTTADQIIVTMGAHNAFVLILRLLVHPGDRVLVEQPTYPNALDAIRASHARPVAVAMTDDGWCLDGIEAALRQSAPRLAYFVPDFHNPTGHRMPADMRAGLAAALRRTRTVAVADETLVELDLDGDPVFGPPPLAHFAPDFVVTIGSASKSHWGGLRIGWVRAPAELVSRIVSIRSAVDLGAPVFEQLVLTELLTDPEPVLRQRRTELAHRRDVLFAALAQHCPLWTVRRPSGGQSAWCQLDEPIATRLAVAAESHGLRLVPGSRFAVDGSWERWLRVPFTLPPAELTEAVTRLGRLARAVGGRSADAAGPVPVA